MAAPREGLRFAFGTMTALPVGAPLRERAVAALGMRLAPLVGLALGLAAGGLCWVLLVLKAGWLLTAVLTLAVLALLTRGVALEGLAGVADALAGDRPADEARRIARGPGVGRLGVLALLFAVLTQIAAVHELAGEGRDYAAMSVVVAVFTSRTAVAWACRELPPAGSGGPAELGALVARSVSTGAAVLLAALAVVVAGAAGAWTAGEPGAGAVVGASAVVLGLTAAELVLWQARGRLGGLTGEVLGAVSETATAVVLVTLVVGAT
ncbi:adenosylcobinamide-GDP ribazoletransferase [Streptomyces profundus]|nr:adenosylcobinamide-GDP ribazoletransferase [Streptomyces sp. MA3_2.13]